jgi:2-methylcitrate dehydratase PrpD
MSNETARLVDYAANLRYEEIPPSALQAARNTIADGISACIYGYRFEWSEIILRYAQEVGASGKSRVLGPGAPSLSPPFAALVNGALAHSFELDGAMKPGVGAHPFATIFPAALAIAQDRACDGRRLLTAFVAATEVLVRIGRATRRSNERRGFHAPGTTGPFGAATAAGILMGLDRGQLLNAIGIAGSLSAGLLQFSKAGTGGMVKRLHFGRAAESGVAAALLASKGFDGPHDVIEGAHGFLHAFCDERDVGELTRGLGSVYLTEDIYMKRFACHGSSQYPLQALQLLRDEHRFDGGDIAAIEVTGTPDLVARHGSVVPTDLALAQYSVPFCLALGCFVDARDPRSFNDDVLNDARIRDLFPRVRYVVDDGLTDPIATEVRVTLRNGKVLRRAVPEVQGMPSVRASRDDVYEKFSILTRDCPRGRMDEMFERLQTLDEQRDVSWIAP